MGNTRPAWTSCFRNLRQTWDRCLPPVNWYLQESWLASSHHRLYRRVRALAFRIFSTFSATGVWITWYAEDFFLLPPLLWFSIPGEFISSGSPHWYYRTDHSGPDKPRLIRRYLFESIDIRSMRLHFRGSHGDMRADSVMEQQRGSGEFKVWF